MKWNIYEYLEFLFFETVIFLYGELKKFKRNDEEILNSL